jgi:hypothetical protein
LAQKTEGVHPRIMYARGTREEGRCLPVKL